LCAAQTMLGRFITTSAGSDLSNQDTLVPIPVPRYSSTSIAAETLYGAQHRGTEVWDLGRNSPSTDVTNLIHRSNFVIFR
jgi:hypothetical protein